MFEGNILQFGQVISLKDQSAFSFGYLFWKLEVLSFSFAQASLCISREAALFLCCLLDFAPS